MTRDEPDLTGVLRLLAPELLAYFQRRVGIDDAPDLLSETMVVAWRRALELPTDPEQVRMWLYGLARGTLPNHRRSQRRRRALAQRMASTFEASVEPASDDGEEVRDAIARLAPDRAELIRLVHWEGFPLVEAAAVLGIPASTARSRYARAKQELRGMLGVSPPHVPPEAGLAHPIEIVLRPSGRITPAEV